MQLAKLLYTNIISRVTKFSFWCVPVFVFLIYQVDCVPRGKVIVIWRLKRCGFLQDVFKFLIVVTSQSLTMGSTEGKAKSGIKVHPFHKFTGCYTAQIPQIPSWLPKILSLSLKTHKTLTEFQEGKQTNKNKHLRAVCRDL